MGTLPHHALRLASDAVYLGCQPHRQLRPHAARLLHDVLAVAAGLRPAAMVDYAKAEPQLLAALVGDVARALRLGTDEGFLVAVLEGCCYVVRPDLLRGLQLARSAFITFQADRPGGGVLPTWADAEAGAAVMGQLSRLVAALSSGARRLDASVARVGLAGGGVPVVELDGLERIPAMPTLSGLLLGYPAVYVVLDLPGAQDASRCLSSSSLCVYSATLLSSCEGQEGPLLAFSVPAVLAGHPRWDEQRAAWLAQLRARVGAAGRRGFPWAGVALHTQHNPPRPIAL